MFVKSIHKILLKYLGPNLWNFFRSVFFLVISELKNFFKFKIF
jgi:hypothetical protein